MKVINTENYFNKIIEIEVNQKFGNNINGLKEDYRGKRFEEVFVELCNKENKTVEENKLLENIFNKKVISAKKIPNNYKADIVVYFEDKTNTYISLKNSKTKFVGGLECSINSFSNFFNDEKLEQSLKVYKELKFSKILFSKNHPDEAKYFQEYINTNKKKFLKFILEGQSDINKPDSIMFLEKEGTKLYFSTIDEYINLIISKGSLGTFNSHTNITRTSGTYCNLKFKIQNPLKLKNL